MSKRKAKAREPEVDDNPVLDGGRIIRPWASRKEVPETVWKGCRWRHKHITDEEYLCRLNEDYHYTWIREQEKMMVERSIQKYGVQPGSKSAPCVGCNSQVPIQRDEDRRHIMGSRLCESCQGMAKKAPIRLGHDWEVQCIA